MGSMVDSLLCVMQDSYHQPYHLSTPKSIQCDPKWVEPGCSWDEPVPEVKVSGSRTCLKGFCNHAAEQWTMVPRVQVYIAFARVWCGIGLARAVMEYASFLASAVRWDVTDNTLCHVLPGPQ